MKSLLLKFAERLMRCPAAPYFEGATRSAAEAICEEHGLEYAHDPFGNLLVAYRHGGKARPLVMAAHLDHPGFQMIRQIRPRRWLARFRGGVGDPYFKAGVPLRILPQGVHARLGSRVGKEREFEVEIEAAMAGHPEFAVWELPDFNVHKGLIEGRACDDLIGCAATLACLVQLKKQRAEVNALGILARAEEVGFHGALMVGEQGLIPRKALVISLETSREMPPVKMGQGVIVRVGDRSSIFDSDATRFLSEVGADLAKEKKKKKLPFQYQRALMSGGTCEGTAYQEFGYQTAALCVALGNYHNCGEQDQIKAEYVSQADAEGMVTLLVSAARRMNEFDALVKKLPVRLKGLAKEAKAEFRRMET